MPESTPHIQPPIILIGPMSAGKSTVAPLLAKELGLPHYELDEFRWDYYKEAGYDDAEAARIVHSDEGTVGLLRYCKPFEAHAVERTVADHADGVIEFGAGHSVYEDPALFARVQRTLAPFPHVILLLPSPDADESIAVLNARFSQLLREEVGEVDPRLLAVNEHFVRHPSNSTLAKQMVYTQGKTPDATCAEIIAQLVAPVNAVNSDTPPRKT